MPGFTRRQLCAGTALAGVTWGLGACDPAGRDPGPGDQGLTLERVRPLVGSQFMVQEQAGGWKALTLAAIIEAGPPVRLPQPRGESFILLFDADFASADQGTRPASHPAIGPFSLFLVPRQASGGGRPARGYTATFTRL